MLTNGTFLGNSKSTNSGQQQHTQYCNKETRKIKCYYIKSSVNATL